MDQRVIDLYDSFTHGDISRRVFLDRLAEIAGSSAAALALLPLLQNRYNKAAADLAWTRTVAFFNENLGAPA